MSVKQDYPDGTWAPSSGAAPATARVLSQARFDLLGVIRNGEQLLLTLIIPLVLLAAGSAFNLSGNDDTSAINVITPGILALAVMSTAFTSLAIAVGFDRRSGALRLLGTTPMTRGNLLAARSLSVAAVEVIQVFLICTVAFALGWAPTPGYAAAVALLVLGTAAFAACGVALAGVLRAEATLAVANGIYLLLLIGGGTVVPVERLPGPLAALATVLPSGALGEGLRSVLTDGAGFPWFNLAVLASWAAVGSLIAARTFRWD